MIAWHCDGPGCDRWQRVYAWPDTWTASWIGIPDANLHFCTWDCVLKYAATKTPTEEVRRR